MELGLDTVMLEGLWAVIEVILAMDLSLMSFLELDVKLEMITFPIEIAMVYLQMSDTIVLVMVGTMTDEECEDRIHQLLVLVVSHLPLPELIMTNLITMIIIVGLGATYRVAHPLQEEHLLVRDPYMIEAIMRKRIVGLQPLVTVLRLWLPDLQCMAVKV
jgi:hypothetical protein